jgi:hypothetical protein
MSANWQWMVYMIGFLSTNDSEFLEYLDESSPIFKQTSLSLEKVEKRAIIQLILSMIKKNEESEQ